MKTKLTAMGHVSADITLSNPRLETLRPLEVHALVDSGANFLCLPRQVADLLQPETNETRDVATADGKRTSCPYVGPVQVRFDGRQCYVGALVLGDQVLLGAIPLEDMELIVSPAERRLVPNPQPLRV